jgi:cyclomaltodextrinase / maltogenic alpha-amylase / neopullulanase
MINYTLSVKAKRLKLGKYLHYKGSIVIVLGAANHSETLEEFVVYRHESDQNNHFWIRPLNMFLESVIVNKKTVRRFRYIGG